MNRRRIFEKVNRGRQLIREVLRVLRDLFFPRRLAWQTVNGRSFTPNSPSRVPMILAIVAALFVLISTLFARDSDADMVEFSSQELQAAYTLVRPETTSVRLHGRSGHFEPAPALRYFGVEPQSFDIDMSAIGEIVDLRFHEVVAKLPVLRFTNDAVEIEVPFEDRAKALRSSLGSISLKGVSLTAVLHWKGASNGMQELRLKSTRFKGNLKGTGVLSVATGRLKSLALRMMAKEINRALARPEMQRNVIAGLSQWGKLTLGDRRVTANPETLSFFRQTTPGGVREGIRFDTRH